jgi:Eukaryotic glutathione synthase, ATP binding domain
MHQVQQVLCQPGEVERFLPAQDADALRQCFAGLWAVGESDNADAAAAASAAAAGNSTNN